MLKLAALALGATLLAATVRHAGPTHDELLRCYFITHPAPAAPAHRDGFELRRSRERFA